MNTIWQNLSATISACNHSESSAVALFQGFFSPFQKNSVWFSRKLSSIFAQNSVFWRKNSVDRIQKWKILPKTQFYCMKIQIIFTKCSQNSSPEKKKHTNPTKFSFFTQKAMALVENAVFCQRTQFFNQKIQFLAKKTQCTGVFEHFKTPDIWWKKTPEIKPRT